MHIKRTYLLHTNFVKFSISTDEFPFVIYHIPNLNIVYKKYIKIIITQTNK